MKRISVILPLFNRESFIEETLRSVERQRRRPDEVIVVNDNSTDGSAAAVRRFAERSTLPVVLVDNTRSKGVSGAMNDGIDAAVGDFIAFLDSDDLWTPFHLEQLEQALERYPKADAAFSRCTVFGDADDVIVKSQEFSGSVRWCLEKAFERTTDDCWLSNDRLVTALLCNGVPFRCQASLMRRRLFAERKLRFNEKVTFTQDAQFLTLAAYGASYVYVDRPGLLLRRHEENNGDLAYRGKAASSYEQRVKEMKAFFGRRSLDREEGKALVKRLVAMQTEVMLIRGRANNFRIRLTEAVRLISIVPCWQSLKEVLKVMYRRLPKGAVPAAADRP